MQTARLLVLRLVVVLLAIAPATAQSQLSNEMLSEVRSEVRSKNIGINSTTSVTSPVGLLVSLPDTPVPQRVKVIDKKFVAVMGALGGAESLRFATHKLVLDHEHAAGVPWVTSVPANQHLIPKYAGIYAAELLVVYELKKPHSWLPGDKVVRKFWWAYPSAMMPIHVKNGIRSIRTQAPSCAVAGCEGQ